MNVRELVTILKFKTDAQSMKSAENAINKIKSMMAKIKPANLKVNTGNLGTAQRSVSSLANTVTRLNGRSINIKTNTSALTNATSKVRALSSQVQKASKTITVNAKANVGNATKQINSLSQRVKSANKTVTVKAKADTTTATKRLQALGQQVAKASKTVTVKANTNALSTATKRVQTLQGAVTRLNGRSVNIRTNTTGLNNVQKKMDNIQKKLAILNKAKVRAIKIGADTSGIDKAIRKLKELDRMQTRTTQNYFRTKAQNVPKQPKAQKTPSATGGMNVIGGLKGAFMALGGFAIISEIKQTADAMMSLSSRIKLVTKDDAERLRVESALYNMSIRNRASLEDLGDLYYKTASSAKQFGATQEDVLKLTDIVSKSLIVGGADTAQQKSTILQLSQALSSGVLQGDELRSLRENAPRLMQEIAKNLGTTMAGLKEMGAKGELTTERLMGAILASGGAIEGEFKRMTPTIGQAITVLGNKWSKFILDIQNNTGVFGQIAGFILDAVDLIGQGIDWAKEEFKTLEPDFQDFFGNLKELWAEMQPLLDNLGTIFRNWIIPALKMFLRVSIATFGMVADLLKPIVDFLDKIASLIATISGGLPGIIKGFDNLIGKAESGALEKYKQITAEYNQNNTVVVESRADAGRALREANNNGFFELTPDG